MDKETAIELERLKKQGKFMADNLTEIQATAYKAEGKAESALLLISQHEKVCAERYEGINTTLASMATKIDIINASVATGAGMGAGAWKLIAFVGIIVNIGAAAWGALK